MVTVLQKSLILAIIIAFALSAEKVYKLVRLGPNALISDAQGYYVYLPATFIYGSFTEVPEALIDDLDKDPLTGKYYSKYTFGVAIMEAPFFLLGHVYAKISAAIPANGFSRPYQFAILFSGLFYGFLGIYYLFRVLLNRFKSVYALWTGFFIFFGTNLMHYTVFEPGMSHVYSFFLVAALLLLLDRLKEANSWKNWILIGLITGLLVFIRPTNLVFGLLIPFWDYQSFKSQFRIIYGLVVLVPMIFIGWLQLEAWQTMRGALLLYSYDNQGFTYWSSPKLLSVWFHVRNGLFIYSPVLIFSIIGLISGIRNAEKRYLLILFIFLLGSWFFASWWAWWFGGAFGHRCYVEFLPLLAFPLAYFLESLQKKHIRIAAMAVACLFTFYTLRMTIKYSPPWDGPAWDWCAWFEVFVRAMLFR